MDDLTKRADRILKAPRAVYSSKPSTVDRVIELYNSVPQPTYVTPEEPEQKKRTRL